MTSRIAQDHGMKHDGGAAFPGTPEYVTTWDGTVQTTREIPNNGMSLRDWFAGQALSGLLANERNEHDDVSYKPDGAAERAYSIADAMLAERTKGER